MAVWYGFSFVSGEVSSDDREGTSLDTLALRPSQDSVSVPLYSPSRSYVFFDLEKTGNNSSYFRE